MKLIQIFGAICSVLPMFAAGQTAKCTCGSNSYSDTDIKNAINQAEGGGGGNYPRSYLDYEGFSFPSCSGEMYEYPPAQGRVYDGGSPGADRIVYDTSGNFCACLTHTGSSSPDGFVECTEQ